MDKGKLYLVEPSSIEDLILIIRNVFVTIHRNVTRNFQNGTMLGRGSNGGYLVGVNIKRGIFFSHKFLYFYFFVCIQNKQ